MTALIEQYHLLIIGWLIVWGFLYTLADTYEDPSTLKLNRTFAFNAASCLLWWGVFPAVVIGIGIAAIYNRKSK